ncbi:hypothetical protein D3C81_1149100 [compost metagenome]
MYGVEGQAGAGAALQDAHDMQPEAGLDQLRQYAVMLRGKERALELRRGFAAEHAAQAAAVVAARAVRQRAGMLREARRIAAHQRQRLRRDFAQRVQRHAWRHLEQDMVGLDPFAVAEAFRTAVVVAAAAGLVRLWDAGLAFQQRHGECVVVLAGHAQADAARFFAHQQAQDGRDRRHLRGIGRVVMMVQLAFDIGVAQFHAVDGDRHVGSPLIQRPRTSCQARPT